MMALAVEEIDVAMDERTKRILLSCCSREEEGWSYCSSKGVPCREEEREIERNRCCLQRARRRTKLIMLWTPREEEGEQEP